MQHTAEIQQLQSRATVITSRIAKLNGSEDQHLAGVAKHFHLGMVGGSGRNTHKLNQRRERAMDKSIAVAKEVTELYKELNTIEAKIKDLQDGGPEKRAKEKEDRAALKAQYWNKLKAMVKDQNVYYCSSTQEIEDYETVFCDHSKYLDKYTRQRYAESLNRYKRITRIGLLTPPELRAAIRELISIINLRRS